MLFGGHRLPSLSSSYTRTVSASVSNPQLFCDETLRLDNVMMNGVADQGADGAETELMHDLRAVGFDRLDTEAQRGGYLFVTLPLGEQLQHFALAR
jgi:hypothetical protein